jgi:hypothetical protein
LFTFGYLVNIIISQYVIFMQNKKKRHTSHSFLMNWELPFLRSNPRKKGQIIDYEDYKYNGVLLDDF